jgi:hypothetical protein
LSPSQLSSFVDHLLGPGALTLPQPSRRQLDLVETIGQHRTAPRFVDRTSINRLRHQHRGGVDQIADALLGRRRVAATVPLEQPPKSTPQRSLHCGGRNSNHLAGGHEVAVVGEGP